MQSLYTGVKGRTYVDACDSAQVPENPHVTIHNRLLSLLERDGALRFSNDLRLHSQQGARSPLEAYLPSLLFISSR